MTRFAYLIIISLLCFGCTHNNGDIGPLFGTWVLDGMTLALTIRSCSFKAK